MFPGSEEDGTIAHRWEILNNKKGDLIARSEAYARWTIPSVCPPSEDKEKSYVIPGARYVNHLANKVVDVMFPYDRPFFMIDLSEKRKQELRREVGPDGMSDVAHMIREEAGMQERLAMQDLDLVSYRPVAVEAMKHQIITGNVMIKRIGKKRVVYGVKDFCVRRDIDGTILEIIHRDETEFGALSDEHQELVKSRYSDKEQKVVLYTRYVRENTGRYHMTQDIENINLKNDRWYNERDFPCLVLTWSIGRGDHYGRGLVEDNAPAFHSLDRTTEALIDMFGIMADIKLFVDPASGIDVEAMMAAPRGAVLQGREGEVWSPNLTKFQDIRTLVESIQRWERELAQAFLVNSGAVRDAERVTAEEIRFYARELESAFGGLYSRLAVEWQLKEAEYVVENLKTVNRNLFDVRIVTGLESLSREGQLENFRLAVADLGLLEAVPEEIRSVINPMKLANFIFHHRGVHLEEILFTQEELQQKQQQMQQQQQQMMDQEADAAMQAEAGKEAVRG